MSASPIVLLDIRKKKRKPVQAPISIRMGDDLVQRLEAMARANHRSRSAEIAFRLEESLRGESIDEHGVIVRHVPGLAK